MSRERRPGFLVEDSLAEPGQYGCPMLVRARVGLLPDPSLPAMRCSLGWALHDGREAARCMATAVLTDCWKVHPERLPDIVPAAGRAIEPAPDHDAVELAVD